MAVTRRRPPQFVTDGAELDETAESERKVRAALERNRVLGRGLKVGKAFKVQGVDGTAWYEITHLAPTTVDVEWRDYALDRCMDEMLAAGGEFPRGVIERLVYQHDTLEELFEALA